MIERVARSLFAASLGPTVSFKLALEIADANWHQFSDELADRWRQSARVAITSMREPTDAMLDAAPNWDCLECDGAGYTTNRDCWSAMIDEALRD